MSVIRYYSLTAMLDLHEEYVREHGMVPTYCSSIIEYVNKKHFEYEKLCNRIETLFMEVDAVTKSFSCIKKYESFVKTIDNEMDAIERCYDFYSEVFVRTRDSLFLGIEKTEALSCGEMKPKFLIESEMANLLSGLKLDMFLVTLESISYVREFLSVTLLCTFDLVLKPNERLPDLESITVHNKADRYCIASVSAKESLPEKQYNFDEPLSITISKTNNSKIHIEATNHVQRNIKLCYMLLACDSMKIPYKRDVSLTNMDVILTGRENVLKNQPESFFELGVDLPKDSTVTVLMLYKLCSDSDSNASTNTIESNNGMLGKLWNKVRNIV